MIQSLIIIEIYRRTLEPSISRPEALNFKKKPATLGGTPEKVGVLSWGLGVWGQINWAGRALLS